jgi:hypothetical protein
VTFLSWYIYFSVCIFKLIYLFQCDIFKLIWMKMYVPILLLYEKKNIFPPNQQFCIYGVQQPLSEMTVNIGIVIYILSMNNAYIYFNVCVFKLIYLLKFVYFWTDTPVSIKSFFCRIPATSFRNDGKHRDRHLHFEHEQCSFLTKERNFSFQFFNLATTKTNIIEHFPCHN